MDWVGRDLKDHDLTAAFQNLKGVYKQEGSQRFERVEH